ncbi:phytanoyl-CoA dioxygenase family protein [Xenophilus arseniciresistens]|uniref:Phytanoyl-CoA dioxygenase family protein n=1 Tax=Xenophilus arseniciresistens TaxID=1283306 RepID=A0AAE3N9P1_9BURK|nr:phytanoyl-CoA dioxygenase family protein [Xenophilus arseniciresistens]MDA7416397.1 phytanoyl-CoA dioxygenase family protein [Xenophilus arseniciresistens]
MASPTPVAPDLAQFAQQGLLALRAFMPARELRPLRQQIEQGLGGLNAPGRARSALAQLPAFQQTTRLAGLIRVPQLQERLLSPALQAAVAALAGRPPGAASSTQLLLSLPRAQAWSLDALNWHVDLTASASAPVPGVQAFFLLADVAPHGGATLALAGSHRLAPEALRALRATLRAGCEPEALAREFGVQVVEMSGRAGDVFLMDMRVLHTPSINASTTARMMATTRFVMTA